MKVVFLNHNVRGRGGTYYRALHLARHLVKRGHDVTLVAISPRRVVGFRESAVDGVRVVESPDLLSGRGRTGWDPWDALQRRLWLARERWDLVHAFDSRPAVVLPALQFRRRGVPLVMDWADWWSRGGTQAERPGRLARLVYGPLETYFEERFRTRADATTAISRMLRDRAISLGVPEQTIRLLPGGCSPDLVVPCDRDEARSALGLAGDSYIVGFMGAASLGDLEILFASFRSLLSRAPGSRLLTVGVSVAGSGLSFDRQVPPDLRHAVVSFGFTPVERLGQHLGACDVLALPLRDSLANNARWPSRIGDYLAAGRPVVATDVSDARDLFRHHIGILAGTDASSFASALLDLKERPERARAFGQNARHLAEGELSWTTLAAGVERIYEEVISSGRTRASAS